MNMGKSGGIFMGAVGLLLVLGCCWSCNRQGGKDSAAGVTEDTEAKQNLQGVWMNEDEETVAFKVVGDSIFFPDSTSVPVYFYISKDTLYMRGANLARYPILKQTAHSFRFVSANGEHVRLVKSQDNDAWPAFGRKRQLSINQNQVVKHDTVVHHGNERYHCYVQVNPTSYKVMKPTYNNDGVEVTNVYYDNIVHLSVFHGAEKVFSSNFAKDDFSVYVPEQYLRQAVLSDMVYRETDGSGVHYLAVIGVPDSPASYIVQVCVGFDGSLSMQVGEDL